MARVLLNNTIVGFLLLLVFANVNAENDDLQLILIYRDFIDAKLATAPCQHDYNLLHDEDIIQDYSFWNKDIATVRNVASYLMSMWPFKDSQNRSLVESVQAIYTLVKTITLSSDQIFGSAICFDKSMFQGRRQFCPYAFKNYTPGTNASYKTIISDWGRLYDYLSPPHPNRKLSGEDNFTWWRISEEYRRNITLPYNTVSYDVDLHRRLRNVINENDTNYGRHFDTRTNYVPDKLGKWTTPYYDCHGGKIWMFTYLTPFYDEAGKFLGIVTFHVNLDSIDINECEAPPDIQIDRRRDRKHKVQFYGNHACHNKTTKCVHLPGGGFKMGNYRCVCREGYYFPRLDAKKKYFDGKDVSKAYGDKSKFNCLPCREGCTTCLDDSPCLYQERMVIRKLILVVNGMTQFLAISAGLFIFLHRETKILKASSPFFMVIIAFGLTLMYTEVTLGFFDETISLCIARSWLYHVGFTLAFASLLLKTWRIAVIFRLRTAKTIELTDKSLLTYLLLILLAVCSYFAIWTLTQDHEYETIKTNSGYKYRRCVKPWFTNAFEIGEVLFLLWGVWLCIRVRNAPSAYNESKYIAWCIYNTLFVKIVVGLLRIVLDNFHNPDVAYVVNSLSTHVIATVMLVLLFAFKVYFLKKYNVNQRRRSRGSSSIATTMTDLRKSPFHLNRLEDGTLVCENDEEKTREGLETENVQLREEIRDLTAKLAACEYKQQREQRRQQGSPQDNSYLSTSSETRHSRFNSETESAQGRESGSPDKIGRKESNVADSLTSNGSVFTREERGGSLIEDIKNADRFIALPNGSSVSDEETLTVMSNVSIESS